MNDDIVTRLRTTDYEYEDAELAFDAADEIERLTDKVADLRMYLEQDACEIKRLSRWKAEATEVIGDWEAVWKAVGKPGALGQYKPNGLLAELGRLDDVIEMLRHEVDLKGSRLDDALDEIERLRADRNRWRELAVNFADAGTHDTAHSIVMDDFMAYKENRND